MHPLDPYIEKNQERFIQELLALLRIPSISADKKYKPAIRQAAQWVREQLAALGADEAALLETEGHPLVYAEKIVDPNLPTILVYGHYDVQPPDPIAAWTSHPFEPTLRGGKIYARGASDDKGQMYAHIKAFETMIATQKLPCNVKFFIEGEEEIGSPSMKRFLQDPKNRERLRADVLLISDTSMPSIDQPVVPIGLRGIALFEISVTGPNRDLHSGVYGGAVKNPLHALSALLATLHDEQHKVTIPHFYEDVVSQTLPHSLFDEDAYKKDLALDHLVGEKGYTTPERVGIRPTLEINGIWGGTMGVKKTVLPAQAHAILSARLVPQQKPEKITARFRDHIHHLAHTHPALEGVQVRVESGPATAALLIPPHSRATRTVQQAFQNAWGGKTPILKHEGGSIPLLTDLHDSLQTDLALLGIGLDNDNIHAPNEKLEVANYLRGIETIMAFHHAFAART